jgi:hypothetical protein
MKTGLPLFPFSASTVRWLKDKADFFRLAVVMHSAAAAEDSAPWFLFAMLRRGRATLGLQRVLATGAVIVHR